MSVGLIFFLILDAFFMLVIYGGLRKNRLNLRRSEKQIQEALNHQICQVFNPEIVCTCKTKKRHELCALTQLEIDTLNLPIEDDPIIKSLQLYRFGDPMNERVINARKDKQR